MNTITSTTEARWNAAVDAIENAGVTVVTNLVPYNGCRCCVSLADLGIQDDDTTTPYAFSDGLEQGFEWDNGILTTYEVDYVAAGYVDGEDEEDMEAVRYYSTPDSHTVTFRHGNGAGALAAMVFAQHGFDVNFDGNDINVVEVVIPA